MKHINQFKERNKNKPEIDHVVDYLKKNYKKDKEITASYIVLLSKANAWIEELNSKVTRDGSIEIVFDYKVDGLTLVKLLDQDAKNFEGASLCHCASTYVDEELYSIRQHGFPLYTLEVQDNYIVQIRGKNNRTVKDKHKDLIMHILNIKLLKVKNVFTLCNLLSFGDKEGYIDFLRNNNLEVPYYEIDRSMFFSDEENVKLVDNGFYNMNVSVPSYNYDIKLPKDINSLKITSEMFTEFVEEGHFQKIIEYVITNEDFFNVYHLFESRISLKCVKILHKRGFEFDVDSLLASLYFCNLDVFKFMYNDLGMRGAWDLLQTAVHAGHNHKLIYILENLIDLNSVSLKDLDLSNSKPHIIDTINKYLNNK